MAFDVGAGIANAADQAGKLAGIAALEQQKSGLEAERLKLANDLAGERESKGRQETAALTTKENTRHEGFLSTEAVEDRKNALAVAGISAGSAAATANAHLKGIQMQIDHAERQPDYKVSDDGTLFTIPKQSKDASGTPVPSKANPVLGADGQPMKVANPEKAKAQSDLIKLTQEEMSSLTRQYEIEYRQAATELTTALKSPSAMIDPEKDPGIAAARKNLLDVQKKYEPQIKAYQRRAQLLSEALTGKTGLSTPTPTGKSLSDFDRGPAAPSAPSPSDSLINGNY